MKKEEISKNLWEAKKKLEEATKKGDPKEIVRAVMEVSINDRNVLSQMSKTISLGMELLDLNLWEKKLMRRHLDKMIEEEERDLEEEKEEE